MPLVKTSAVLLAMSLCGAWALVLAASAAAGPVQGPIGLRAEPSATAVQHAASPREQAQGDSWLQTTMRTARQAVGVVLAGYERAPVLVTVLSALLVVPAAALVSLLVRRAVRLAKRKRRQSPLTGDWRRGPRPGPNVPAWPAQAWLSIEGEATGAHPVAGEMIRIGRHPDNEVWLTDTSVHRYHAVIHRTEDADFFITDLSGDEGNGVRVNGTRRLRSPLADGDVIELGKARITFASIPI